MAQAQPEQYPEWPASHLEPVAFNIPEQPLSQALKRFAEQAELQFFYRTGSLPKLRVGVNGLLTPQQALEQLLQPTGLDYSIGTGPMLVIIPRATATVAPEPTPKEDKPHIEETYVIGVRSSLALSLDEKRASTQLLDLVYSEDIGKFPDHNVADALQRIAGVSVDRVWGEGRDVNIRGTDKDINRTLLNGQQVASAYWWANDNLSRGFNYTTLASELVHVLEVHKAPRADMDEGSIGGTVNVRTRQPLALSELELRGAVSAHYDDLSEELDPQGSVFASWRNRQRSFGVLGSLSHKTHNSRRDGLENFSEYNLYSITDNAGNTTKDAYASWGGGSALLQQERRHNTGNLSVQWAPDRHWDSRLNLLRSRVKIRNQNHNFLFVPGGYKLREQPPARVDNPVFITSPDGTPKLAAGTLENPNSVGAVLDSIQRSAYINTEVDDFSVRYQNDAWQTQLQLGQTRARGGTEHDRLYRFTGRTRVWFDLTNDAIETRYLDLDPERAADMGEFSPLSRDWIRSMENREQYLQLDTSYQWHAPWQLKLKTGVKYRDTQAQNHRSVGTIDEAHPLWGELSRVGLERVNTELTPELSRANANKHTLTRYATANPKLLTTVIDPYFQQGVMRYHYDQQAHFRIDEQITAYYLTLDLEQGPWAFNTGVRLADTDRQVHGYRENEAAVVESHHRAWLPNANLRYRMSEELLLRASIGRTMARPNTQDLAPQRLFDPTSGSGAEGNPTLRPYRANQFDISAEWYFASTSLLAATLFYKDLTSYIYPVANREFIENTPMAIVRPENRPGPNISGLELQWQHSFDNNLGFISNYTYTHARMPRFANLATHLPGNSKSQFNLSVYYERRGVNARLAYNYRSRSHGEISAGSQAQTAAHQQWDAKLEWPIANMASMSLEAINITNQVSKVRTSEGLPQGFYETGRRFLLGLRWEY